MFFLVTLYTACVGKDNKVSNAEESSIVIDNSNLKRYHKSEVFWGDGDSVRLISDSSLLNGVYFEEYENGSLLREDMIVDGVQHGFCRSYYKSGSKEWVGNWRFGRMHGDWMRYYENGFLMSIGQFYDGGIDGVAVDYYENGQIKSETRFVSGKLHGESKGYYDDGLVNYVVKWDKGEIVKETRWDTNGYIVTSD